MNSIKINSVVKLYTLCLLNNGPKHGYEIIKELESSMNRSISASHVYPFLKTLEDKEVIECKAVEERERKKYELTNNGKEFINIVFGKLGGLIDTVIGNKLISCHSCDCKVYDGGHMELINNEETIFCCPHCASAYKETCIKN